jgi:hypothetical protein
MEGLAAGVLPVLRHVVDLDISEETNSAAGIRCLIYHMRGIVGCHASEISRKLAVSYSGAKISGF